MTSNSDLENAYALIIGISKYRDPRIPELRFTRADAEGIYELLTDPKKVGLNPDNIKLLLDQDATAFNIKNAISSWLFKNAEPDSVVFIYFAGHGGVEEDRLGVEKDKLAKYLLPYDASFDDLYSSAISNRDFNELLLTIRSTKLVIFMDSCYSGGVSERKARDLKITEDPYQKIGEGEGRIVIAASKPDQRSFEDSRLGHGVFTYNLIEALSGKADRNKVGYVTVLDAYKYLENNVHDLARKLAGGEQDPVLRGDISKDFAISVNRERLEEIKKEQYREVKLKKLREFYRAGKFRGKLYEKLRMVTETDIDSLQNKEKDLAKLINDLISEHISIETFFENLGDIEPELFEKPPEEMERDISGKKEEEQRKKKEREEYERKEKEKKAIQKEEPLEISGKIFIQNTNNLLAKATISFTLDNDIRKIVSDENGSFSFNVPRKYLDQYIEYEATRDGYGSRSGRFQIKDSRDFRLKIELAPKEEKKIISKIPSIISSIPVQGKIVLILIALIAMVILAIPENPSLAVSPDPVSINIGEIMEGENASGVFLISNSGKGTLNWKVSADKPWVTIIPMGGTDSGKINIQVNTDGLKPGEYSGIINITSNGGDRSGTIFFSIPTPHPEFINSIGMIFNQIPAGEFDMGSLSNVGAFEWEMPLHRVEIEKDFWMGEHEVTNKQWFDVMGYNTSDFKGDNLPVVQVSWEDVQKFIKKLNEKERTNKYRLPTEAEWEYAARAGTTANYSFGDNATKLDEYAWYLENSGNSPHPIGQKKPNKWELYDMHGNVWEWVQDEWHDNYGDAPTNGSAWKSGNFVSSVTKRVGRGGSWAVAAVYCRSAIRFYAKQSDGEVDLGFRVVKDL